MSEARGEQQLLSQLKRMKGETRGTNLDRLNALDADRQIGLRPEPLEVGPVKTAMTAGRQADYMVKTTD